MKYKLHIIVPILLFAVTLLALPVFAQDQPPDIPHPVEGRETCLACHETGVMGAPQVPENHEGRTEDTCQGCHQPAEIPDILHLIEDREVCLACHETGIMGAPVVPDSHEGRENDQCLDCHKKAEVPEVPHSLEGRERCTDCHAAEEGEMSEATPAPMPTFVPTPLAYPQPEGEINTCEACHLGLGGAQAQPAKDWQVSIHAERGVVCADCHGGDPSATDKEESMSEEAGFIGKPDRTDIPDLCGSCHADVNQMRQYDLPTDQLAKYKESQHGQLLAEGDTKVATCYDCHDGHATRQTNDPQTSVYHTNVPALCASCHADESYMAEYDIPTNQYELYQDSVHGIALLDNQDTRSPSCATCHGTHGAAPPGFDEVANVCGSCHEATQNYFLKGVHSSSDSPESPDCVACHGRYDVTEPSEQNFLGDDPRHCGSCHEPDSSAGQTVEEMYKLLSDADESFEVAEQAVQRSIGLGMIMAEEESLLAEARTKLITARAAQHTVDLSVVEEETLGSIDLSEQAYEQAEEAIAQTRVRRLAMVIALFIIALTIFALVLLRRQLVKE